MPLKRIIGKMHLWLGLSSGLVVFILAVTGCLYAFQEEIQNLTQPYRYVEAQDAPFLPPSKLQEIARNELPGKLLHSVKYNQTGKSAEAVFYNYNPEYYYSVYLNPYNGKVLKVRDNEATFFRFVIEGHYYLWLPPHIGQPVVATATLLFVIILITGLILWFPKNLQALKRALRIIWNKDTRWKRKTFDLHIVLGYYASLVALVIAFTGLIWGFQWFAHGVYYGTGGKKSLVYSDPGSVKQKADTIKSSELAIDIIWFRMQKEYPQAKSIEVHPPANDSASIAANANMKSGTWWKTDYRYFDQYTLKEMPVNHIYGKLAETSFADKMIRMNYDIHTGAIAGLPGKIIIFLATLIIASLPITGFLIWRIKGNKSKG